ncbi:MAG: carbamoyltransferase HypF [Desulfuromonadaceae bacterium]|nr:carbamoyltransferase HypF [Desulfuromonadaceae bacterium]MDD2847462.1 carbamoyltransferase HypF [Desulfuromonadaceae bacterium]MDD4131425.1 carbamoyltransferase HypF [Desulfuromonadaceae bacterium]
MAPQRGKALTHRQRHTLGGIVQGVGFRPFVYRLAQERDLTGWVRNTPAGVEIEIQGDDNALESFDSALRNNLPPLAQVTSHDCSAIPAGDERSFTILPSGTGSADIRIAPDSALCPDCLRELFDPADRRHRYPFITCTNCGPRYSIITTSPYDRPNTTMTGFPLCPDCQREYLDPLDRRFHAQPIACHSCGPQVSLLTSSGEEIAARDAAAIQATELLKEGAILAIKGVGGYHLAVDACNHDAVQRLRQRKQRDEKPFAVMAADLTTVRQLALTDALEERLLSSPEAPIVIVRKRPDTGLAPLIAPGNGWLGLMLPYAPLHHLLMQDNFPALVMTSGNIASEPVAFEDHEALQRLAGIADYFLLHDRPIHIRSDDSVLRVFQGRPLFYRRARGYAPRAVALPFTVTPTLATGAELKSAVCLANGHHAFLSQHIGDLQNQSTLDSFAHTVAHLSDLLAIKPELIACDLHPDYLSSRFAEDSSAPLIRVQHHHAHLASCMAENGLEGDAIGIIFDGTGYGPDGTVWGGEFLIGGYDGYRRAAHFRPVPLPGGDAAVHEPWRMAMAYLYQACGETAFTLDHPAANQLPEQEQALFAQMLRRRINSPLTSSCGRLFDAVAALINVRQRVSYDGQAAIELEALAESAEEGSSSRPSPEYPYKIIDHAEEPLQLDFSPMMLAILADMHAGIPASSIAYRFHTTVASAATEICLQLAETSGLERVILSGGVFQNRLLSEMIYTALSHRGLHVFTHHLVPPNDGGIALGQAAIAGRRRI